MKYISLLVLLSAFIAAQPSYAAGFLDCFKRNVKAALEEPTAHLSLDPALTQPLNYSIPRIEQKAYQVLETTPGTAGLIRFNEVIDEAVRVDAEYPKALLKLAINRLPYIQHEPTVVFISGGVADPWAPALEEAAKAQGMQIKLVKLPGSLSSARGGNQRPVPEFTPELKAFLKDHPAIFLDDTYTNGGTAHAVRDSVNKAGGKLDGVFVVYEGGKGDPASLYKTGRNNRRPPSLGNFPEQPTHWKWADGQPKKLAIEITGTLTNASDSTRLTEQGKNLLAQMEKMGTPVQFLLHGHAVDPPAWVHSQFKTLRTLKPDDHADLAIGNWGREFRGVGRSTHTLTSPQIETVRIGGYRDEGILSEDLLDPNYFLNRLSEMGVLRPEFARRPVPIAANDLKLPVEIDLRNSAAPKAERGSHNLNAMLDIADPKARVAQLSKIHWDELTHHEQTILLERSPKLSNSFEIGQMIRIAGESNDLRWKPVLEGWIESWKDVSKGWQTFVRPDAEKALGGLRLKGVETSSSHLGSLDNRLKSPVTRFSSTSSQLEFEIPQEQVAAASRQVDHALLKDTLFIIPNNDGEARRATEILKAAGASHLQVSKQEWGATLDKEAIDPQKLKGVKRVVVFEIPGESTEAKLRAEGLDVIPLDHHAYKGLDRRRTESSLEQLMALIHWPMSRTDEALAVNDRGYIPGLKKLGLSEDEIRQIRKYDLAAQGRTEHEVDVAIAQAHALVPHLPQKNGVYVLDRVGADEAILKQELAIQSKDGLVSTFEVRPEKIGFSGNPAIVQALLKTKFEDLGYEPGSFAQYGGGDPQASMFFGFKPTNPPNGETELIPKRVLDKIESMMNPKPPLVASTGAEMDDEVRAAGMLPRGSAIITSSGNLSQQGIRHIIHAATGSMNRGGPKFDPTVKSVTDSIHNALDLAREYGDHRVAVPFIGGKIFVDRIGVSPQELADHIVEAAIRNRGTIELRFVTFGDEDTQLFKRALAKYGHGLNATQAAVTPGSITDFSLHGATAIINAANKEVRFGGGLSGAIGRATGNSNQIDAEAQNAIQNFYAQ